MQLPVNCVRDFGTDGPIHGLMSLESRSCGTGRGASCADPMHASAALSHVRAPADANGRTLMTLDSRCADSSGMRYKFLISQARAFVAEGGEDGQWVEIVAPVGDLAIPDGDHRTTAPSGKSMRRAVATSQESIDSP